VACWACRLCAVTIPVASTRLKNRTIFFIFL
jgi:hypothetical protein